jgi:hypothetical protein
MDDEPQALIPIIGIGPTHRVNSPSTFRRYAHVYDNSIASELIQRDTIPARRRKYVYLADAFGQDEYELAYE